MLAAGTVGVVVWLRRRRYGAVYALGITLTAVAAFGPSIRPWYLLWGLVPIAVAAPDGLLRRWLPAASAVLAVMVPPSGFWPTPHRVILAAMGVAMSCVALWLTSRARGIDLLALPPPTEPAPEHAT
jgi:alpha-1,6-mannosyltransferase